MVYSRLDKHHKRSVIIGQVTQIEPHVILKYQNQTKHLVISTPVTFQINQWIRAFGVSKGQLYFADAYHPIQPQDISLFFSFRQRIRQFYREID
ncbi:hypothetical protein NEHOM01_2271 [Nematocida homosporus]|uniref:uncharacterized protein n=1 Tax=Nematocida homosporus TaxID=1912981 RepID=UPI00221FD17E|nr:uncharacterized protein NEHOM01_2271 [Nematocida homosporus]KAI5187563.1 hypothetical protein NEHOM01_2271 [Nematocida homosporus]